MKVQLINWINSASDFFLPEAALTKVQERAQALTLIFIYIYDRALRVSQGIYGIISFLAGGGIVSPE